MKKKERKRMDDLMGLQEKECWNNEMEITSWVTDVVQGTVGGISEWAGESHIIAIF